jgi:pyruvate/2-oxoglutarate/acetoin dehydrogenase E1 component
MRIAILVCCILALALLALIGLSYMAEIPSEVSVTGIDNGVIIQNVGNTPCVVVVNSVEGEQQFKLAVGANVTLVTLSHIERPINVMTFGSRTVPVDLVHLFKPAEGWPRITHNLSSNFT